LALAIFLARARSLRGTFFLDEPLTHLDDLNRIGLLDVLRAFALEGHGLVSLVITTASRMVARHLIEKFSRLSDDEGGPGALPTLRVIEIRGNGRYGLEKIDVFPAALSNDGNRTG
jgi:energy-coupling factor transporter ATP-binding protein EcfA2